MAVFTFLGFISLQFSWPLQIVSVFKLDHYLSLMLYMAYELKFLSFSFSFFSQFLVLVYCFKCSCKFIICMRLWYEAIMETPQSRILNQWKVYKFANKTRLDFGQNTFGHTVSKNKKQKSNSAVVKTKFTARWETHVEQNVRSTILH